VSRFEHIEWRQGEGQRDVDERTFGLSSRE